MASPLIGMNLSPMLKDQNCGICLSEYEDKSPALAHCTGHSFHELCFSGWVEQCQKENRYTTCPSCRARITSVNGVPLEHPRPLIQPEINSPVVLVEQERLRHLEWLREPRQYYRLANPPDNYRDDLLRETLHKISRTSGYPIFLVHVEFHRLIHAVILKLRERSRPDLEPFRSPPGVLNGKIAEYLENVGALSRQELEVELREEHRRIPQEVLNFFSALYRPSIPEENEAYEPE